MTTNLTLVQTLARWVKKTNDHEGLIRWFTFIKFKRVKTLLEQQRKRESYREMYNFRDNVNVQLILQYFYSLGLGSTWQVLFIYNICKFSTLYLYVNLPVIKYTRILMNFVEGLIETVYSRQTSSSFHAFASFGVVGKSSFNICPVKLLRQLDVIRWRHALNQLAVEMVGLLGSLTLASFLSSKRVRTRTKTDNETRPSSSLF